MQWSIQKRSWSLGAASLAVLGLSGVVQAGPYSPGKGGQAEINAGFKDAGIPLFIGPAGDGVGPNANNGNYVNPAFVAWATGVVDYSPSEPIGAGGINVPFTDPTAALGPANGDVMRIVSLGDMSRAKIDAYLADPENAEWKPGSLTLSFNTPITNGAGADFAAFENGFVSGYTTGAGSGAGQMFAELGYVEVSTNGIDFARFPSIYLNYPDGDGLPTSTGYLTQDVSNIYNLVGKHANAYSMSFGTPFDLDDLIDHPLVLDGLVDLNLINYVRIVDIPGDGSFTDSLGNPIYDAWLTWGSGGLDFAGVGVLNQWMDNPAIVPTPAAAGLAMLGSVLLMTQRRRQA